MESEAEPLRQILYSPLDVGQLVLVGICCENSELVCARADSTNEVPNYFLTTQLFNALEMTWHYRWYFDFINRFKEIVINFMVTNINYRGHSR